MALGECRSALLVISVEVGLMVRSIDEGFVGVVIGEVDVGLGES